MVSRIETKVGIRVKIMGVEDGTLQVLLWEKHEVKAETDFVISWKWRNL